MNVIKFINFLANRGFTRSYIEKIINDLRLWGVIPRHVRGAPAHQISARDAANVLCIAAGAHYPIKTRATYHRVSRLYLGGLRVSQETIVDAVERAISLAGSPDASCNEIRIRRGWGDAIAIYADCNIARYIDVEPERSLRGFYMNGPRGSYFVPNSKSVACLEGAAFVSEGVLSGAFITLVADSLYGRVAA